MTASSQPWVGRISATGAILVYDAALQISKHSQIYVFSVLRGVVRQFDPNELRTIAKTIYGDEREAALLAYEDWKFSHAEEFLKKEPLRLAEETQRIKAAETRIRNAHRQYLIGLGLNPESALSRLAEPRRHRVTHCFACKQPLDNKIFLECAACHWIICSCGACGCGYSRNMSP